jgi:hypothetical protein
LRCVASLLNPSPGEPPRQANISEPTSHQSLNQLDAFTQAVSGANAAWTMQDGPEGGTSDGQLSSLPHDHSGAFSPRSFLEQGEINASQENLANGVSLLDDGLGDAVDALPDNSPSAALTITHTAPFNDSSAEGFVKIVDA